MTDSSNGRVVGFRRHLRAEVVPDDAVFVFSEDGATALRGAYLELLAPWLDGSRDLAALRSEIPPDAEPDQIVGVLARLADAGLVTLRPPPGADEPALAFWESCGIDADEALACNARSRVRLITVDTDHVIAVEALRAAGLAVHTGAGDADLSLVLCRDYLAEGLADIDAEHRRTGIPWLLAKPAGARVWVGPIFTPGDGACWHCLAVRLWEHRPAEAYVRDCLGLRGAVPRPAVTIRPLTTIALNLIALEAAKWLAGYRYSGQHSVWTFDARELDGRHHEITVRPQCPSCGDPTLMRQQARQPIVLHGQPKSHTTGGGHRAVPAEEILATYRHLISPITGVVKEIRRDPRGPAFLNSFHSGPNLALRARNMHHLRSALRYENGGKGITPLDAEVSALCEALERHSAHLQGDEERVASTFRSLGDTAIHPDACQLFHPDQFANRKAWNAAHSPFQFVPEPFDEKAVLDWTPVWSLTHRRHRLLPTALLYVGTHSRQILADSNGNAAGSSTEDAILHGLLELVERDAVALWWYNRTRQPGVDLDAFGDPWITELHMVYAGLRRQVWVLDVTSDFGIPVMVAVSRRTDQPREDIMFGFGAHLDPEVALRRALTELNQLIPAVIGTEDHNGIDLDAQSWWNHATINNQPYLIPDPHQPQRHPASYPQLSSPDLAEDVHTVQTRLEAAGLEVLVLNQTRPDIGLPVVKVIVPGMRGFWARFAPGRLYDIPVQLGRLSRPTTYSNLNPLPLFL